MIRTFALKQRHRRCPHQQKGARVRMKREARALADTIPSERLLQFAKHHGIRLSLHEVNPAGPLVGRMFEDPRWKNLYRAFITQVVEPSLAEIAA